MSEFIKTTAGYLKSGRPEMSSLAVIIFFSGLVTFMTGCKQNADNQTSQLEANKAIVMRAWEEGFNQGNNDVIKEVFDESYVESSPYETYEPRGVQRVLEADEWMKGVFGELHFDVEQLIAEGDYVVSRVMATGVHIGKFAGVEATCNPVRFAVVVVSKVSNGKIVQDWSFVDTMEILKQIGKVTVEQQN
jgi:predicted ester cyclase